MAQYNSLNVILLNSRSNKFQYATKNKAELILRLPSNMIVSFDDEINFPHKLLIANKQVANLCHVFANNSSTDIKLSKTQ